MSTYQNNGSVTKEAPLAHAWRVTANWVVQMRLMWFGLAVGFGASSALYFRLFAVGGNFSTGFYLAIRAASIFFLWLGWIPLWKTFRAWILFTIALVVINVLLMPVI